MSGEALLVTQQTTLQRAIMLRPYPTKLDRQRSNHQQRNTHLLLKIRNNTANNYMYLMTLRLILWTNFFWYSELHFWYQLVAWIWRLRRTNTLTLAISTFLDCFVRLYIFGTVLANDIALIRVHFPVLRFILAALSLALWPSHVSFSLNCLPTSIWIRNSKPTFWTGWP